MQGDIIGVYSNEGVKLISYSYDAWGNVTTTYYNSGASTAATVNPFKYRGYYHDSETGLYYLNSRYYDPVTGRFINADSQLNIGDGVLGCNMYIYCLNNPVNGYDPCGTCFHRWDFWNDCDKCGGKNLGTKIGDAVSAVGSAVVSAVKAVGNFVVDRFSTPEKASNTLCVIGFALDFAATYCGLVAIGLSIPTLGMSIPTAGTAAAILATASLAFYGAALVIEIYNEE